MNNLDVKFLYPVKRIGNEKNPKLIILLSNPGGDPKSYKRLPEYVMEKNDLYSATRMNLAMEREYCLWWDDILKKTDKYISDSDILALEFYPYHTVKSSDIPQNQQNWNSFAKESLEENINLLKKFMDKDISIFGYYWGDWLKEVPELEQYPNFYKSKNTQAKGNKIKDLVSFLSEKKI